MNITTSILTTTVYGTANGNYDGSSQDWSSDPVKAANYYRGQGGLQTIIFSLIGFEGIVHIEATLDSDPAEATWFETFVYGDGSSIPITDYHPENILGNFVWVRARVSGFDGGTINYINITY